MIFNWENEKDLFQPLEFSDHLKDVEDALAEGVLPPNIKNRTLRFSGPVDPPKPKDYRPYA